MGLDMYLYLRKTDYKSRMRGEPGWSDSKLEYPNELKDFQNNIFERNFMSVDTTIDYQVGYWRKANAIHNWFVEHCAGGVDDCNAVTLRLKDIIELQYACNQVLEDHYKAKELLPPQSGFFFGSTEIDDWYFKELEYTADLLSKVEAFLESDEGKHYECVYQASW